MQTSVISMDDMRGGICIKKIFYLNIIKRRQCCRGPHNFKLASRRLETRDLQYKDCCFNMATAEVVIITPTMNLHEKLCTSICAQETLSWLSYKNLLMFARQIFPHSCDIQRRWPETSSFRSGPEGSRKLRFPDFMTTAQGGGKVVSLMHRPPLPPGNPADTHFYQRQSRPQGNSAIGRIMSMKNSNDTIWNRTSNLPICSTAP